MTVKECMEFVDDVKPNAFPPYAKIRWIGELEGKIANEIFLMAPCELKQFAYTGAEAANFELLLDPPYDDLYISYLTAKVDSKNGEFNRLSTTAQAFNRKWQEFAAFIGNLYAPANGYYGYRGGYSG